MEIEVNETNNVKIISFSGDMDSNTSQEAEKKSAEMIEKKVSKLVFDFEKLNYISSSGLRVILATTKRMSAYGGQLHVCNLNDTVKEVFDISGFSTIIKVFDNEQDAINNF